MSDINAVDTSPEVDPDTGEDVNTGKSFDEVIDDGLLDLFMSQMNNLISNERQMLSEWKERTGG